MIKIGIIVTFKKNKSVWTNGINQNSFFLANLLKLSEEKYDVHILNIYDDTCTYEEYKIEKSFPACLEMNILINISGLLSVNQLKLCRNKGIKIVHYLCGNNYFNDMEGVIFKNGISNNVGHIHEIDECWYVPQQHDCNEWYYKTLFSEKSFPVPFIWSPTFLEQEYELVKNHKKSYSNKNIAIMEPNINTCKYCMYPILITEQAYNKNNNKEYINHLYTFNSDKIKEKTSFVNNIKRLKLYEDKKITFEGRLKTPEVLCKHADIVVSHQICNNLNYLYLDIAYLGYPIIHNANLCKNIGYYYKEFDVDQASTILEDVLQNHDDNKEEYIRRNKKEINKYLITNPDIIKCYDNLILGLFKDTNINLKYNSETNLFDNCVDVEEELQVYNNNPNNYKNMNGKP